MGNERVGMISRGAETANLWGIACGGIPRHDVTAGIRNAPGGSLAVIRPPAGS